MSQESRPQSESSRAAVFQPVVAPSPHLAAGSLTTRRMMIDVMLALVPAMIAAVVVFRWYAVVQVGLSVLSCLATEYCCERMRGRRARLNDCSAALTGVILGLSLPWSASWYVPVLGGVVAVGVGKAAFGGLGCNIFNPAMVGRAFVMLSFAQQMGAAAYVATEHRLEILTRATPLSVAKQWTTDVVSGRTPDETLQEQLTTPTDYRRLLLPHTNGSLGEISALGLLIGGIYLCLRRTATWDIPLAVILGGLITGQALHAARLTPLNGIGHILNGALLFCAFFIATDPVTSPLVSRARALFGLGIGVLVVLIRVLSGYPEGVMFAVLVMNALVPLLNRWTIPRPLGARAAEGKHQ